MILGLDCDPWPWGACMRTLDLSIYLPAIVLLSFAGCQKPAEVTRESVPPASEDIVAFIKADGGLRMRSGPGAAAEVVKLIPDGGSVTIVEEEREETIGGRRGRWTKVRYEDQSGWVFGGFLVRGNGDGRSQSGQSRVTAAIEDLERDLPVFSFVQPSGVGLCSDHSPNDGGKRRIQERTWQSGTDGWCKVQSVAESKDAVEIIGETNSPALGVGRWQCIIDRETMVQAIESGKIFQITCKFPI